MDMQPAFDNVRIVLSKDFDFCRDGLSEDRFWFDKNWKVMNLLMIGMTI